MHRRKDQVLLCYPILPVLYNAFFVDFGLKPWTPRAPFSDRPLFGLLQDFEECRPPFPTTGIQNMTSADDRVLYIVSPIRAG
jgi:hypothetical protein